MGLETDAAPIASSCSCIAINWFAIHGAATDATPLPVADFASHPAVQTLLRTPGGQISASFVDPYDRVGRTTPALAVARSPDSLPDWTLILEQDIDAALRPHR